MNRDRRKVVRVLKESIGEPATEALTNYVHMTLKENNESMYNTHFKHLTTKEEFADFRGATQGDFANFRIEMQGDFADFRSGMLEDFANFRSEMKTEFSDFRSEVKGDLSKLEIKISDTKSDTIRWMFAFFVTMLMAVIGLYFKK